MMNRMLLGSTLALVLVAAGCEDPNRRTGGTTGRTDTTTRTDTSTIRETTTATLSSRFKVQKIDKEKNQVTLVPAAEADTAGGEVQPTAGREQTMSFEEFKTKASFVGDINSLKEGQEVTLKQEGSGMSPDTNQTDTNTGSGTNTGTGTSTEGATDRP